MAVKTFTTGSVLTASDTNTYLANSGLVYVASATVGSGVSSVTVTNCFSSTYDRYKIIYSGGIFSVGGDFLTMTLPGTGSASYSAMMYQQATSFPLVTSGTSAVTVWRIGITGNTSNSFYDLDLQSPYSGNWKLASCQFIAGDNSTSYGGSTKNWNVNSTVQTGFSLAPGSGTMTGGQITVYGYRKA